MQQTVNNKPNFVMKRPLEGLSEKNFISFPLVQPEFLLDG
jgi:hypothetical protein